MKIIDNHICFLTLHGMREYINNQTRMEVVSKKHAKSVKDNKFYIFSPEGREYLGKNGYHDKRELKARLAGFFNCSNCGEQEKACKKCQSIQAVINNL